MPRSRKEKRQHYDSAPEQRARVIKSGYDGFGSSRDFMVSGHSTGSQNSEMEALSHQVSIDAGRVPDYDSNSAQSDGGFNFSRGSSSIAAPLENGSISRGIPYGKIATGISITAIGGALAYLTYRYFANYREDLDSAL